MIYNSNATRILPIIIIKNIIIIMTILKSSTLTIFQQYNVNASITSRLMNSSTRCTAFTTTTTTTAGRPTCAVWKYNNKVHPFSFSTSSSSSSTLYSNTNSNTNSNSNSHQKQHFLHQNNIQHIMAPMVAQSDLPFRILCRLYNTQLCYTQMIHAHNFVKSTSFQKNHLDVYTTNNNGSNSRSDNCVRSKLYMSESGWNILDDLNWNTFEQQCTFLQDQYQQDYYHPYHNDNHIQIDTNEIYNLIQLCKHDHEHFITKNNDNNNHHDDDDNDTSCDYDSFQSYGLYYEGLPTTTTSCTTIEKKNDEQHPLIVQLAGYDPQIMTQAAQSILQLTNNNNKNNNENDNNNIISNNYSGPINGIDINCGCPQAIARKGNYGAFLMENDVPTVCKIIQSLKESLPSNVNVSVKMRIPPEYSSSNNSHHDAYKVLKSRIDAMVDSGVDLITIHGRTLHENKTKVRHCNWDSIKDAKSILLQHDTKYIPIVANGGIENYQNVIECLDYTNADAVMSSESLLENPGLFHNLSQEHEQQSPKDIFQQQIRYCHEYLDLCILFPPLPGSLGKKGGSFNVIRSHLFKMLYRYLEEQSDLRTLLAEPRKMSSIQNARNLLYELERRYHDVIDLEYDKLRWRGNNEMKNNRMLWVDLKSSNPNSSWYRRHRDAIASNKMHVRGDKGGDDQIMTCMNIDEKKKAIRERIEKLKREKEIKQQEKDEAIAM